MTHHQQTNTYPASLKKLLLPTPPPLFLLLSVTLYGMEYLFGQFGLAVLATQVNRRFLFNGGWTRTPNEVKPNYDFNPETAM